MYEDKENRVRCAGVLLNLAITKKSKKCAGDLARKVTCWAGFCSQGLYIA